MNKYFTSGYWVVKKGKEEAFRAEWKKFADWSSSNINDSGKGFLLQDLDNPQIFISFGEWDSLDNIENWRSSTEFQSFIKRMESVCEQIEAHKTILREST